jgi:alkanesulfonate monooxygenase SsuD/methylene tetrahydromethanopterin reductase-like flavin-dependent oxidoreductase (luciferase family)
MSAPSRPSSPLSSLSSSTAPALSSALPAPAYRPGRTLHLAAAIEGPARGYGRQPAEHIELARMAEGGALDFVTLEVPPGGGPLDAFEPLARVAAATDRIGLVAAVTDAGADPVLVAEAVTALDEASRGRAGWAVRVPGARAWVPAQRRTGRRVRQPGPRTEAQWRAAEAAAEAVVLAWDGGRRARPPHGRPVTALDATEPAARTAAARHADIAFVRTADPEHARRIRAELRQAAAGAGRDPDRLRVLAELSVDLCGGELGPEPGARIALGPDGSGGVLFGGGPVDLAELIADWQRSGAADGFHIRPLRPRGDLERFVNGTTALLQHRGLFRSFHPGATLREHLALHRPPAGPPTAR